jgi:predicted PurR-regulated permease PerM
MQGQLERGSFLLMLALVTVLFFYLLKPFFGVVFWACVIGLLFYPLQVCLLRRLGNRKNLTAMLVLLICFIIGIVPLLFIIFSFFQEGAALYQRLESGELDPGAYLDNISKAFPFVQQGLERFDIDLDNIKEQFAGAVVAASQFIAQYAVKIGQGTLQFFVGLGLVLYLSFFMIRDGEKIIEDLIRALPLGDQRERLLFDKFAEVTRATIKGNLVVAAVQGTLGGLIFWILSIPGALLWGVVMTIMSLIPVVGAGLIWVPVAIYFFIVGDWVKGLILVLFGAGVIGLVDNVLRPILVGRDTKLPDYIVLFSTLGGITFFGINGFVMGPLVAGLFVAVWGIFIRDFNTPSDHAK